MFDQPTPDDKEQAGMDDASLLGVIGQFEQESYGFASGELQQQRAYAIERYLGLPFGDEVDGRSSVVSTDLRDTIEWILPQILRVFLSGDEVVKFQASGPEDERAAELETQYINYVILERNDAFNVFSTWFRDALMSKVGYVKAYWQERTDIKLERYQGLTEDQIMMLAQDPGVQIVKHKAYPDPYAPPAPPMGAMGQQPSQPPGAATVAPAPPPMLHDVECRRTYPCGHVKVDNVPPEEIRVHRSLRTVSVEDCIFIQHITEKTVSELRQDGFDIPDDFTSGSDDDGDDEIEIARDRFGDEDLDSNSKDPSTKLVRVKESYARIDYDGDGVAELRKVVSVGRKILTYAEDGRKANEEAEFIPFAAVTPIVFPHRHVGIGYDDLTKMQGEVSTAIMRQYLDNLYLANNGRYGVDVNMVNVDDLLVTRPGGLVRTNGNPALGLMPITHPVVGPQALEGLQWAERWREMSTGVSADQSNMSADVLQKATATSISQAVSAGQSRVEAVTRSFAAGAKDLFQIVHALTLMNSTAAEKVKLNNEWQTVDPREWVKRTNMQIVVGLGTGSKESRIAMLMQLAQLQAQGLQAGIVTPPNLYNTGKQITQEMGYKNGDEFWTDPAKNPPKPPPPDPAIQVAQLKAQTDKELKGMEQQDKQMEFQAKSVLDEKRMREEFAVQQANDVRQSVLDQQKMQLEREKMEREYELKQWEKQQELAMQWQIEQFRAQHQAQLTAFQADHTGQLEEKKMAYSGQMKEKELAHDGAKTQFVAKQKEEGDSKAQAPVLEHLKQLQESMNAPAKIIRGPDGRATHVERGGNKRKITRSKDGRAEGLE